MKLRNIGAVVHAPLLVPANGELTAPSGEILATLALADWVTFGKRHLEVFAKVFTHTVESREMLVVEVVFNDVNANGKLYDMWRTFGIIDVSVLEWHNSLENELKNLLKKELVGLP